MSHRGPGALAGGCGGCTSIAAYRGSMFIASNTQKILIRGTFWANPQRDVMQMALDILGSIDWSPVGIVSLAGRILALIFVVISLTLLFALALGYRAYRRGKVLFPRPILLLIDVFYGPLKRLFRIFRRDPRLVDDISIVLRNHVNYDDYAAVPPKDRVVLVPQCLRHTRCPAPMSSEDGFTCRVCGMCVIAKIYKVGDAIGTEVYIAPGGRFAKRILMRSKHAGKRAVLGVACHTDLYEGMLASKIGGIPAQGVPLTTEGCVSTQVDIDRVIDMLLVGLDEEEAARIRETIA
ncbi:MAG TPA: DUF116 domain-containing protein [Thermoplasmata archaeon]|nr:DUF116 domain-containing protein [Thermoplasmata archaeon]